MHIKAIFKNKPLSLKLLLFSKKYGFKIKILKTNPLTIYIVEFNKDSLFNCQSCDNIKLILITSISNFEWDDNYYKDFDGICTLEFFIYYIYEIITYIQNPTGFFISPDLTEKIIKENTTSNTCDATYFNYLTFKENQVMQLLKQGNSYKEVGNALNISLNTVRMHIKNLYRKLNIKTKDELISFHSKINTKEKKTNNYERKKYKFSKQELTVFNYI